MKQLFTLLAIAMLSYTAKAQLTNPSFEVWDTSTTTLGLYPHGWTSLDGHVCPQITPAQHGTYALQVSVWYYYAKSVALQEAPISSRPLFFTGFYQYTNNELRSLASGTGETIPDTAVAQVFFTKWNTTTLTRDTIGSGSQYLWHSTAYNQFAVPVNYTSTAMPDSVTVILDPSVALSSLTIASSTTGYCSYLTVDNLSFADVVGVGATTAAERLQVFPNPASKTLYIAVSSNNTYSYMLTNTIGKTCLTGNVDKQNNRIDVSHLAAGIYNLMATDKEGNNVCKEMIVKQP